MYDIDFNSPTHTVGSAPATGAGTAPRNTVTKVNFGTPTVVSSFGVLTAQPLEFNALDGQGDQIQLDLTDLPADSTYVLTAEIVVSEIASGGSFRVFFDTPQVRSISFNPDGSVSAIPGGTIGTFDFGNKIDLKVEIDLANDLWNIYLDGMWSLSTDFWGTTQVNAIRFTTDVLSSPPGSSAAIDNLSVTVSSTLAPTPPHALYELDFNSPTHTVGSAPATGAGTAPRKTVSKINFGTPTVVSSFGVLADQPLEFNALDGQGDQIQLDLTGLTVGPTYVLTTEIVVSEIASGGRFNVIFDTPQVRSISFLSDGSVSAIPGGVIGTIDFGDKIDLKVEIDLANDLWNVYLGGILSLSTDFWGTTQVNAIRLTTDVVSSPPGSSAAIDNLRVTVSP